MRHDWCSLSLSLFLAADTTASKSTFRSCIMVTSISKSKRGITSVGSDSQARKIALEDKSVFSHCYLLSSLR